MKIPTDAQRRAAMDRLIEEVGDDLPPPHDLELDEGGLPIDPEPIEPRGLAVGIPVRVADPPDRWRSVFSASGTSASSETARAS